MNGFFLVMKGKGKVLIIFLLLLFAYEWFHYFYTEIRFDQWKNCSKKKRIINWFFNNEKKRKENDNSLEDWNSGILKLNRKKLFYSGFFLCIFFLGRVGWFQFSIRIISFVFEVHQIISSYQPYYSLSTFFPRQ